MTGRRAKLLFLLSGLVLSGLIFLAWTQAWFLLVLDSTTPLSIAGDVAAPALSTLALTCLVLNGALSIAGPVFRAILGVLEAALGGTVVLSGVLALADPVKASAASVSDATGVAGGESIAALVASVTITAWPWIATVAGGLLALLGVVVVVTAGRWPGSGRKYSAVRLEAADGGSVDDWDALSEGHDPT